MNRTAIALCAAALGILAASLPPRFAKAHFPWLSMDDQGRALLFFGESPHDRAYKLPEAVAKTAVFSRTADGELTELKLQPVEEQDLVGLRSGEPLADGVALEATCQYGLYHGMLLTYYARHLPGGGAQWQALDRAKEPALQIRPAVGDQGVTLAAIWQGGPRKGVSIVLIDATGDQHEGQTDDNGALVFKGVAAGPAGVTANFVDETKGEFEGKTYESIGHYATLTFDVPASAGTGAKADADSYPALPQAVASFGGAAADGYVYVYSGHTGEEHDHSRENLSQHFWRLKLNGGTAWEELPMQTPLQGLPLAAHDGKLYRVGGLSARNAPGEEEDLHSVDEFACYDPATGQWTALAPLPEARSSHDAVVIGDVLYVVGGWTLTGTSKGIWLDTAWGFDLGNPQGDWKAISAPPFRRRALAAGQWKGKLAAVGGMTEDRETSRRVDVLDLDSGQWSHVADLPGEGMDGFGVSAWNQSERLLASGTQDFAFVLSGDGSQWKPVARLQQPRFFHRLLPGENGKLLAVGGACEAGHLADIEVITPELQRRPEQ